LCDIESPQCKIGKQATINDFVPMAVSKVAVNQAIGGTGCSTRYSFRERKYLATSS